MELLDWELLGWNSLAGSFLAGTSWLEPLEKNLLSWVPVLDFPAGPPSGLRGKAS